MCLFIIVVIIIIIIIIIIIHSLIHCYHVHPPSIYFVASWTKTSLHQFSNVSFSYSLNLVL